MALYTVMCSGKRQWWAEGYPTEEEQNLLNEENETEDNGRNNEENLSPKNVEQISNQ